MNIQLSAIIKPNQDIILAARIRSLEWAQLLARIINNTTLNLLVTYVHVVDD